MDPRRHITRPSAAQDHNGDPRVQISAGAHYADALDSCGDPRPPEGLVPAIRQVAVVHVLGWVEAVIGAGGGREGGHDVLSVINPKLAKAVRRLARAAFPPRLPVTACLATPEAP